MTRHLPTFESPPVQAQAAGAVTTSEGQRSFQDCIQSVGEFCNLPDNWDKYGGKPAHPLAVGFAVKLLEKVSLIPEIPAPLVRPISHGVFIEWRSGDSRLYFEVDDESVLQHIRKADGEETLEDPDFNFEEAAKTVGRFHRNVAP